MPRDLIDHFQSASAAVDTYCSALCEIVAKNTAPEAQALRHGFAWIATYAALLRANAAFAARVLVVDKSVALERTLLGILFGEYLAQLRGGIMMSAHEFIRASDFAAHDADAALWRNPSVKYLLAHGNTPEQRAMVALMLTQHQNQSPYDGLDETHQMMRTQFQRFARDKINPHAHDWHLRNALIPQDLIDEMAELGVFALTIAPEYGGLGMDKIAMCVVTEELSRGFIGVGSLSTRTEIASELIMQNGTSAQKTRYLKPLARGDILPTAVFTEPDIGSDLANLTTRAERCDDGYHIFGAKTWITHAARANLMTLLVRTSSESAGHKGLSMLLVEKSSASGAGDFGLTGLSGSEIEVLGYRGMREYALSFDDVVVPHDALLGGVEGVGFKQLMQTFESARIQTAARAIGVAQSALDVGFSYAQARHQFGASIFSFPRIADKLVMMQAELMGVRHLTYHAAAQKQAGVRCDLEAGMAKLLAARIAWSAADNAVQIHGGSGFALEYAASRILCDARILSIFEGTAEIQAEIIVRRLLEA